MPFLVVGILVILGSFGLPSPSYAAGTAEMEARILSGRGVVPTDEVTRILDTPDLCESRGNDLDVTAKECLESYPGGTRVAVLFVRGNATTRVTDRNGNLITFAFTDNNGDETVLDEEREVITERPSPVPVRTCSAFDIASCIQNLPGMIFAGLALLILTLSVGILVVAGSVFNWVVLRTVYEFGTYFGTSDGLLTAWGIMRDIANIGLLFGFIFMGVMLILNVDGGGHGHGGGMSAKKAIPRLIIFAVLLNFSLFASQAVIDVSNALSSSFATLAGQENCSSVTTTSTETGNVNASDEASKCTNVGIAGAMLTASGLNSIFNLDAVKEGFDNLIDRPYTYTVSLILLSVFVIVTAMVLLAGAIMLIIRVVTLSLLMVTSPIGFAGMAIPSLQGIASMWWSRLFSQAFFAPVYLLLIFISIKMTEGLMEGNASLANALIGDQGVSTSGNMQMVMVFLIVIGFMIGSLMAASKMGAMGAKFATSTAAGMTVGAVGFAGRRSIGVASSRAAESIRKSKFGHTETGRLFAGFADYGSKANYDLRSIKGAGAIKGIDLGKPQKGGYDAIVHHATEEREKYAKSLNQTDADKAKEQGLKKEKTNLQAENASLASTRTEAKKASDATKRGIEEQVAVLEKQHKPAIDARADERKIQESKYAAALARNDTVAAKEEESALRSLTAEHRRLAAVESEEVAKIREGIAEVDIRYSSMLDAIDKRSKEIGTRTAAIDKEIKGEKDENDHVIDTGVGGNSASYRYAADLHRTQNSPTNVVSAGGRAGHHAAGSIVKNANKTKIEKALDQIKGAAEKSDKEKESDHVEADHGGGTKKAADSHDH